MFLNKTIIIPLAFFGYEMIIANLVLRALLVSIISYLTRTCATIKGSLEQPRGMNLNQSEVSLSSLHIAVFGSSHTNRSLYRHF